MLRLLLLLPLLMDTYPRNEAIDVQHYAFELALTDATDQIHGTATIRARFLDDQQTEFRLDLVGLTEDGKGMKVSAIRQDGRDVAFVHADDAVTITLGSSPAAGVEVAFEIEYAGIPANGLQISPNKHGDRTFFSDNWPNRAHNWLPTVDHISDKATHEFVIRAPSKYQVVSNGLLIEESDLPDGMRLSHWKQSVPTSPWLYCLGVAEFAVQLVDHFDGKEIQSWVFRQDRDAGFYDYAVPSKQSLAFYTDYVGPYAYEKLANVQSNSVGGGMEAASAIFYSDNSVVGDRNTRWRNVIIHEIAHQWFGNAVTEADWDHVWLSEGVTTFFTLLFREYAYGRDDFVDGLKQARQRVWSFHQDNPDYRIVHEDLDDMSRVTSSQTYQKGAWVMHMLRTLIGDEAFRAGIQAYYREYFNSNATTDDLKRHMEMASGQDLTHFFEQWLYQGGHVELEGNWQYGDGAVQVEIAQTQTGYDFAIPVEIGVYVNGSDVPSIHSVDLSGSTTGSLSIPVDGRPDRVVIDPRTVLLAEWEFTELR